jgi:uncharacterized protein
MKAASPCIDICALDPSGVCLGCFRSRDEIARWSQLSDFARAFINETAEERRRRHVQKSLEETP